MSDSGPSIKFGISSECTIPHHRSGTTLETGMQYDLKNDNKINLDMYGNNNSIIGDFGIEHSLSNVHFDKRQLHVHILKKSIGSYIRYGVVDNQKIIGAGLVGAMSIPFDHEEMTNLKIWSKIGIDGYNASPSLSIKAGVSISYKID